MSDNTYSPNGWPLPTGCTPAPQGCICPPTSEQTCQNPTCPRKPMTIKVWAGTALKEDRG